MKRAEYAFKHQLKKQKDKHEKELADRDAKLAEMELPQQTAIDMSMMQITNKMF